MQILTITGSDFDSGAGIQADLKTFRMHGVFRTSAIITITAQNTFGAVVVHLVLTGVIRSQTEAVHGDLQISASKLGILGMMEIIGYVAEYLKEYSFGPIVLDPVMVAEDGAPPLYDSVVAAVKRHLLLLADALTPNLPGMQVLAGVDMGNVQDAERTARVLQDAGVKIVVIKGGHSGDSHSAQCTDWVFLSDGEKLELSSCRYLMPHTYDTGCTFPTHVAAELARGFSIENAVKMVKACVVAAIANPLNVGSGHGPVNHQVYRD